ncbi:MAG: magnesium transporter CorA family protein [candidate division Zixibacteria bacterium]|nr:magnesium transporter CorA family protein [candidate division Zixibacteria bacterium]
MQKKFQIVNHILVETDSEQAPVTVVINPDDTEKRYLVDTLRIDEHTLASALDPDELSRLEFEPEHLALIYKRPRSYTAADQFLFKVSSVGAFLFKDKLILVVSEDVPLAEGLQSIRVTSPAEMVLRLIYRAILHYREHLKVISAISDDLQEKIAKSMENRHLLNLFTLQKSLVYYLSSITSNTALLEKLKLNSTKIGFPTEEIELLDDIIIENNQCYKQAEIYSNILAGLMDARVSVVSNNLNMLMKTLNIITIAIMVPTFVVSAFSMNVRIPLEEHPYAFFIIMGLALLSVLSFLAFWRYRRW